MPAMSSGALQRAFPALVEMPQLVVPGEPVDLSKFPTDAEGADLDKDKAKKKTKKHRERLNELQEILYAGGEHAVLVVLQAIDAGGKDSTIRRVFGRLNPQGCRVSSFKVPTSLEASHDFLWRHHAACPAKGMIGIHNRSHYESVIVERVKDLVSEPTWRGRYAHIRHFEHMLADEGTVIVKLFLHLSKDEQKERFLDRQQRPDKHWKFSPGDLDERKRWDEYQDAFREALQETSTRDAPWYAMPADQKWYRDYLVSGLMVNVLENLNLQYPPAPPNIEQFEIE